MFTPLRERFKIGDLLKMTPKPDKDIPDFQTESEYGICVGHDDNPMPHEGPYIRVYEFKSGSVWKYDNYWDIELLEKDSKDV